MARDSKEQIDSKHKSDRFDKSVVPTLRQHPAAEDNDLEYYKVAASLILCNTSRTAKDGEIDVSVSDSNPLFQDSCRL